MPITAALRLPLDYDGLNAPSASLLGLPESELKSVRILRRSIDARHKNNVYFSLTVEICLADSRAESAVARKHGLILRAPDEPITFETGKTPMPCRPVIVGAGPAGLFCAYALAQNGYRPIVLERGKPVDERSFDYKRFALTGELDSESNVCFGEGGAGAFSDGKLMSRIKDPLSGYVLETLVEHGAPEETLYDYHPHLGTETIRAAVKSLRLKIESLGGEIRFNTKLTGVNIKNGSIRSCSVCQKDGPRYNIDALTLVLAHGHSARDTIQTLFSQGLNVIPKPFAVGLRIEHRREAIDRAQYGRFAGHPRLGAAEYHLAAKSSGRGVYTFCMCPGGVVVNSSTEPGLTCVNGMSYRARDLENSNSALLVAVSPADFGPGALSGVEFQRRYERLAYHPSGVITQRLADLASGAITSRFGGVRPSVERSVAGDLNGVLPGFVIKGILEGAAQFGRKLKGFDSPDAVLSGVETRSSSPVTFLREGMEAAGVSGVYPCGEGSGHAGGIVSAAVDGLKAARAVMLKYSPDYKGEL